MGNNPAVSVDTSVASQFAAVPYLNHALITFAPANTTFGTAFAASTQPSMFLDPNTMQGLVLELTPDTWQSRLKALSCPTSEPVYLAVAAHFGALAVADPNGLRDAVALPDKVYVGRRTSAVVSAQTITFDTNTAGRVRVRVNPAKYIYADSSPAGALADTTVVADGVLTVADLADDLAAQLTAITDFAARFTAVSDAVDTVTITSLRPGYPLVIDLRASTPGPTVARVITTANVAGAYATDLDEMQAAAEFGALVDPPTRKYYWITDLQGDDVVNAEGMDWVEDEEDDNTPVRDYQFAAWSTSGEARVLIGANYVGNFDPTSTHSAAALAAAADGGTGWTRASVWDHDRAEFIVPALLGRTIGYLPGRVSFTSKVLQGSVAAAKIAPRDHGDNETLTDDRKFNWYSADGPGIDGMAKWGYLSDGSYMDRKWIPDYVDYQVRVDLLSWMALKNIVTYTDTDIEAGKAVIRQAIAKVPAVIADSIGVTSLSRDQVNPNNIIARVYYDYHGDGDVGGVINKIGTPSSPVSIVLTDG